MDLELPKDFKEFLKLLNKHGVEYLLIGGYAVGYYGYPRTTNDMDIWIAVEQRNADKMVSVFRDFGYGAADLDATPFLVEHNIVRMGVPPMRIEVMTTISGVTFTACYGTRQTVIIDGVSVSLIGLEQLKLNKRASARHKDLDDLEHLE